MTQANALPNPQAIAQIAQWLADAGLDSVEIRAPNGDRLRIGVEGGSVQNGMAPQSLAKLEEAPSSVLVESPYFGRFTLTDRPNAGPVAKGAVLGMLELDLISLPILAPCGGHVAETLVEPGALVGYGEGVFRLVPTR